MTAKKRRAERAELIRLMLEIASLNRGEYRVLRAEMWESVARSHTHKPDERLASWHTKAC